MTYVMADLHGNVQRFRNVMEKIDLKADDTLYVLGDVIDRYPDGVAILQTLMELPQAKMLLGNHEYMMLNALDPQSAGDGGAEAEDARAYALALWYYNGGMATHDAMNALSGEERSRIFRRLRSLPLNLEATVGEKKFLFVHGAPVSLCPEGEDPTYWAVWTRLTPDCELPEDKTVIFGHTPTSHYQFTNPLSVWFGQSRIGIDCGAGYPSDCARSGRLACVRLEDMAIYYSEN